MGFDLQTAVVHLNGIILLASAAHTELRFTTFRNRPEMDNKMCGSTEITFSENSVHEKARCLHQCLNVDNCTGVFYMWQTGKCVGCRTSYTYYQMSGGISSDILHEIGFVYYEMQDCLFRYGNSCYFFTTQADYVQTTAECLIRGALPVKVESENENDLIKSKLLHITNEFWYQSYAYYIGISDEQEEGVWRFYSSNETISFVGWFIGEPNGEKGENCAAFWSTFSDRFQWADVGCDYQLKMICEKRMI